MRGTAPFVDRLPPQDLEAEKALLGSIMLRPDVVFDVLDSVNPDSFYSERHKVIFKAMLDLASKREPIDLLTVTTKLREQKELEGIGGTPYVSELLNTVPSATNVDYYAEIVRKKAVLRNLINASNHIGELAYSEEKELEHVLEEAEKRMYNITNISKGQKLEKIQDLLDDAWDRFEKLQQSGQHTRGVPTGFIEIDNKLSGFQKADLIILAARPSVGKTSLALDFARHAAVKENIPVAIFSLEMSKQQLVDRMVSAESRVDSWKLRTGKLSLDEDFASLQEAIARLAKAPITIDDQAGNSIMRMRSVMRRYNSQHTDAPIGLVIVDYLQLMTTSKSYDNVVNQVTEISRSLKGLAKEFNVPVIALSQLSRAVEARGGKPRLSDLRDSGSIEQDADVVAFIHREDKYQDNPEKPNIVEILIEKHRNGPTGRVELYFDDKKTSFLSVEKSEFTGWIIVLIYGPYRKTLRRIY
jgi:replicative DNA helicase